MTDIKHLLQNLFHILTTWCPLSHLINSMCQPFVRIHLYTNGDHLYRSQASEIEMAGNSTIQDCVPARTSGILATISFLGLPINVLLMKILMKDLRLALPRHSLILSLAISDAVQLFVLFLFTSIAMLFGLTTNDSACEVARQIIGFFMRLTLIVSSLNIVGLSFERFIACVKPFRLDEIISYRRVLSWVSFNWLYGIVSSIVTTAIVSQDHFVSENVIFFDVSAKLIIAVTVTISSLIILSIQIRLYIFSKAKITRVRPMETNENQAAFRNRQIKVVFITTILPGAFIFSMVPMAGLFARELITDKESPQILRKLFLLLPVLNAMGDSLIYGFGITDTRIKMLREIRKIANRRRGRLESRRSTIRRLPSLPFSTNQMPSIF